MDLAGLKADHPTVYQAAFDAGVTSVDVTASSAQAATAEHDRIYAILNHDEAKGREDQAKVLADDAGVSVEMAGKLLATMPVVAEPKAGVNEFTQHMQDLGNPDLGAGAERDDPTPAAVASAGWDSAFDSVTGGK